MRVVKYYYEEEVILFLIYVNKDSYAKNLLKKKVYLAIKLYGEKILHEKYIC